MQSNNPKPGDVFRTPQGSIRTVVEVIPPYGDFYKVRVPTGAIYLFSSYMVKHYYHLVYSFNDELKELLND